MQPVYQNPNQPTTETVYRSSLIVWLAMMFSQFLFLAVLYFVKPQVFGLSVGEESGRSTVNESASFYPILIVLAAIGALTFALSFVIKARLLKYAIDNLTVGLVQSAHIVAFALCEATSLFGFVAAIAVDSRYFWVWFAAGILGLALHFPRRESFHAAAFKGIK